MARWPAQGASPLRNEMPFTLLALPRRCACAYPEGGGGHGKDPELRPEAAPHRPSAHPSLRGSWAPAIRPLSPTTIAPACPASGLLAVGGQRRAGLGEAAGERRREPALVEV